MNMSDMVQQERQQLVISALVAGRTQTEAAAAAGVSEKTVYRYLRDPKFRVQLAAARSAQWAPVARRLRAGVERALQVIEDLMNSETSHESTKLRAAVAYLELAVKFDDVTNTAPRLAAMEDAIAERREGEADDE